ncbi:hypothetical protein [Paracoccus tegillarcae]|nr:hypothetical protein [Paracoccus tegillarcae]
MIEFILIACLQDTPEECRTESRLLSDMTLIQCMTSSQFLVADWGKNHPEWQIQKHRCRVFQADRAEI